jgi:hypothetical protein
MAATLPAGGCVFLRKAYNAASGKADERADTIACSPARGLCSPGRQTEREPVPYPVANFLVARTAERSLLLFTSIRKR